MKTGTCKLKWRKAVVGGDSDRGGEPYRLSRFSHLDDLAHRLNSRLNRPDDCVGSATASVPEALAAWAAHPRDRRSLTALTPVEPCRCRPILQRLMSQGRRTFPSFSDAQY